MPRSFRMYGKKRGDRRTGSEAWGSAGEALFFGFFLFIGCAGLVLLLAMVVVPEWRANHAFVETTCTVLKTRVAHRNDDDTYHRPEIHIRYRVDGQQYETWAYDATGVFSRNYEEKRAIIEQFVPGQTYPCWYDLRNPYRVILVKGYSWWLWLLILLPVAFIGIGGAGLILTLLNWGKSLEHRAVAARRVASLDVFQSQPAAIRNYPSIPHDGNLTNSPGTRLAYRLPVNISQGWRLLAAVLACVIWNAIVVALAIMAVRKHLQGEPEWMLTAFVAPFMLAGIAFIGILLRQLFLTTGVGPTAIEISDHPLYLGQTYRLFIGQIGRLNMKSLTVSLVCDEEANYRQGTDTRTDRRRVFENSVYAKHDFEIQIGNAFEDFSSVTIPAAAMHSFKGDHNEVQWKLLVRGDAAGWPAFERTYPVVVYPGKPRQPV